MYQPSIYICIYLYSKSCKRNQNGNEMRMNNVLSAFLSAMCMRSVFCLCIKVLAAMLYVCCQFIYVDFCQDKKFLCCLLAFGLINLLVTIERGQNFAVALSICQLKFIYNFYSFVVQLIRYYFCKHTYHQMLIQCVDFHRK